MNTKAECKHYSGRIWINGQLNGRGNICADLNNTPAGGELRVIAYVPKITKEAIENAVEAMGWKLSEWL